MSFFPRSLIGAGVPWSAHLKAYYHLQKSLEHAREFDIVHTHLSSSSDLYMFPLASGLATPHVTTLHSRFPFDRVQSWTGDADRYYMEWAPYVPLVAISETARDEVPSSYRVVGVVHHGLPMNQFRPTGCSRGDFFAWLGRFVPAKGAHLAIEAARCANVPLVLAGVVDRSQQESIHYFEDMIRPHIDHQRIEYIGPVNMHEKIRLFSCARGFLNPIEWEEPFGMVMIEAMALGCPVISFARGAAPEILLHGRTGFLVPDVDEMVRFIPRIDDIDRQVTRMHVERNFTARIMAEQYVRIYRKLIAEYKSVSVHRCSQAATQAIVPLAARL